MGRQDRSRSPLMRPAGRKGWVKTKASCQVEGELKVMYQTTKLAHMIRGTDNG